MFKRSAHPSEQQRLPRSQSDWPMKPSRGPSLDHKVFCASLELEHDTINIKIKNETVTAENKTF
jgi:hypothetical protein